MVPVSLDWLAVRTCGGWMGSGSLRQKSHPTRSFQCNPGGFMRAAPLSQPAPDQFSKPRTKPKRVRVVDT